MNINVSPAFRVTGLNGNVTTPSKRKKLIRAERSGGGEKKRGGELWASFLVYTGKPFELTYPIFLHKILYCWESGALDLLKCSFVLHKQFGTSSRIPVGQ